MAKYKEEFIFKLSKPIKYQKGSEFKDCIELILKAPSIKTHHRFANILQALFVPAMLKSQKMMSDIVEGKNDKSSKEVNEDEANKILCNFAILAMGKDINDFYDTFEKLLISEKICFLDNEVQIDEVDLNSLNYNDFKELALEYVANFFIVSWMASWGAK